MKIYFLVEGEQTEKKLYRAWMGHCFPQLTEVVQPSDLANDSYFILSGMGYPSYLTRVPRALEDAVNHGADHLFICIDAEEKSYEERLEEIQGILDDSAEELRARGLPYTGKTHIIVATCCIESWLLGHRKLVPRQNLSTSLATFKQFYDVSAEDPELMNRPEGYLTRSSFHLEYLREVFRHHAKAYSKTRPGMATEANYLSALRDRSLDESPSATHLSSFRILWETWSAMGARHEVEAPPSPASL